jgi:hypothetical protein
MKYDLIKYWRRHVNDNKCSLKDTNCSLVRHKNTCRFAVEAYCLSPWTPESSRCPGTGSRCLLEGGGGVNRRIKIINVNPKTLLYSKTGSHRNEGCFE